MNKAIKPYETVYNGYRFRSRLEARWAVFFDSLGVKYEYEPEGFKLPGLGGYLPDFRVMCHGTRGDCLDEAWPLYIEVKGQMDAASAEKIKAFSFYHAWDDFEWPEPNDPNRDKKEQEHREEIERTHFSLLLVGDIPNVATPDDVTDSYTMGSYDSMGFDLCPFNYKTVDGDYFAAYPAADARGRFYLMGDDCHYVNQCDEPRVMRAYQKARQARFEHGERP